MSLAVCYMNNMGSKEVKCSHCAGSFIILVASVAQLVQSKGPVRV